MKNAVITLFVLIATLPYFLAPSLPQEDGNRREVASIEELYLDQEMEEQVSDKDCVECAIQKQQNQMQQMLAQSIAANQQILMAMGQGNQAPQSMPIYQQMDALSAQMLASSMPAMNGHQFQTPVLDQLYQQQFISNQAGWAPSCAIEFAMPPADGFSFIAPYSSTTLQGNDPYGRFDNFFTMPEFNFSNNEESMPQVASSETPMFI